MQTRFQTLGHQGSCLLAHSHSYDHEGIPGDPDRIRLSSTDKAISGRPLDQDCWSIDFDRASRTEIRSEVIIAYQYQAFGRVSCLDTHSYRGITLLLFAAKKYLH
jgi:hypothetical protein